MCLIWPWKHVSTNLNYEKQIKNEVKKRNGWVSPPKHLISPSVHRISSNKAHRPLSNDLFETSPSQSMAKSEETHSKPRIDGNFPKRQAKTPKEKRLAFGRHSGHFHLCYRGDKLGNPLKVNISWFMVNFWNFMAANPEVLNPNLRKAVTYDVTSKPVSLWCHYGVRNFNSAERSFKCWWCGNLFFLSLSLPWTSWLSVIVHITDS